MTPNPNVQWRIANHDSLCMNSSCSLGVKKGDVCVWFAPRDFDSAPRKYGCLKCQQKYYSWLTEPIPEVVPVDPDPKEQVITLISFSFAKGVPENVSKDHRFDVRRTVRNPWRNESLRKLNGLHPSVQDFVRRCGRSQGVITKIISTPFWLNDPLWAVGCQGGKHRSVAIVELAAKALLEANRKVEIVHRDLKLGKE